MIIKKHIERTLSKLERKFNAALGSSDPDEATYYAKLATLEYCGWIEESLDAIVKRAVRAKIMSQPFRQIFDYAIIDNNHGFQYKENFRPMIMRAVGILKTESLEQFLIASGQFDLLKSELNAVKDDRNDAAHTWINGVTKSYAAPSLTRGRLERLCPVLKDIYRQIM